MEEWSTGFYMGLTDGDATDPGTDAAAALAVHWTTFFTGATTGVATAYKTDQIKVSQLETDGDVDLDMIDIYDYSPHITGVSGGAPLPPQITLAATMTSDNQRGLAAKGRMYLPGINYPVVTANPRIGNTERDAIRTALKTFFDAVNANVDIPNYVILASKGRKLNGPTPGEYSYIGGKLAAVTGIRVGNVYDTQRRRRGDVPEEYATGVLA